MALDRSKVLRRFALAGLLGLAAAGSAPLAMGQDHTADPYKPYNSAYDTFTYPQYPNSYGLMPNQAVLEGRSGYSGANRFQDYIDGGDYSGDTPIGGRRTGPGVPYYSSYRRYDRDYGRVYQPNQAADEEFYKDQQSKHDKYMEYLREKDPKRRAELFREYTKGSQKVNRDLAASRNSQARTGAGTAAGSGTGSSAAARTPTAPGLNRGSSAPAAGGRSSITGSGRSSLIGSGRSTTRETTPPSPRSSLFPSRPGTTLSPSETLRLNDERDMQNRARNRTAPGLRPR